jgi:hypothetical protein
MELSSTSRRPQALIVTGLGVGQAPAGQTMFATIPRRLARAVPMARALMTPAPPSGETREEAWHSYAVYSGALSPRHHKSSWRLP